MRVVIMADRRVATRERAMLARLEVGLADEGIRVVHAVPRDVLDRAAADSGRGLGVLSQSDWASVGSGDLADASLGLFSTPVGYATSRFSIGRAGRVRALRSAIVASSLEAEAEQIDLVHAFGIGCWGEAIELARQTNAGLLIELCESGSLGRASGLVLSQSGRTPHFITGEASVRDALLKRSPKAMVRHVPWGVHVPASCRVLGRLDRPLAFAVLADASDARGILGVLGGIQESIARAAQASPGLEPVILLDAADAPPKRTAAAWSHARKLGLLDRLTLVSEMEARRDPVLEMDVLVVANAVGRQRTLTLEAMAAGMIVVAQRDPFVQTLSDGVTARLVKDSSPSAWAEAIGSIASDFQGTKALAESAHRFVQRECVAATQVAGVLAAYQRVMDGARSPSVA